MPDTRSHRGPHPEDRELFAPRALEALRQAAADLGWLLNRGYATPSALKLVATLPAVCRQRIAVARSVCSDTAAARREEHRRAGSVGATAVDDGYNVLTTVEALAGGVILPPATARSAIWPACTAAIAAWPKPRPRLNCSAT